MSFSYHSWILKLRPCHLLKFIPRQSIYLSLMILCFWPSHHVSCHWTKVDANKFQLYRTNNIWTISIIFPFSRSKHSKKKSQQPASTVSSNKNKQFKIWYFISDKRTHMIWKHYWLTNLIFNFRYQISIFMDAKQFHYLHKVFKWLQFT